MVALKCFEIKILDGVFSVPQCHEYPSKDHHGVFTLRIVFRRPHPQRNYIRDRLIIQCSDLDGWVVSQRWVVGQHKSEHCSNL